MHQKIFIIAEVGSVHDGSFGNAKELIELAKKCGADAVKFQTHIAEAETLPDAPNPPYFQEESRFEYFKRTAFSFEQWKALKAHAGKHRIEFLSSPFSIEAVELLEKVGMQRYKIPSGEVTNLPLLEMVGKTGKPVLLSSGMSSWEELDTAVATLRKFHDRLTVLQCTSEYPCPPERVGLNLITEMRERYKLPVGLSDHTLENFAAFAAVTMGISVLEKHLTFSRKMYGSDAAHSLEPAEFADLIKGVRSIESMVESHVLKSDTGQLKTMKETFEKSIVSLQEIPAGAVLTKDMLGCKKPGTGISASHLLSVLGKRSKRKISAGVLLSEKDVE